MAKPKKRRSPSYIAITHGLTSGFAIPLVANVLAGFAIVEWRLTDWLAIAAGTAISLAGYVGGTFYSLAYLRKTTLADHWSASLGMSIVVFAIWLGVAIALHLIFLPVDVTAVAVLAIFNAVVLALFVVITRFGFASNDAAQARGFPVLQA